MIVENPNQPPDHVTSFFRNRVWPPNRKSVPSIHTISGWREQQPGIDNPARRRVPPYFSRAFAILGWRGSEEYFRASSRIISRWVNECGKADVLAERRAMKRNPHKRKLRAMMAAYWTGEPREPAWIVDPAK